MRPGESDRETLPLEHVTPYDRFAWSDTDIEALLVTGGYQTELTAYFGSQEYRELAKLARRAHQVPLEEAAMRVFVVPGIMGSQLGLHRQQPLPHDILWLDPIDIGIGRLATLRLPARAPIVSLGVVLYSYLKLKLHLRIQGFAPVFHDYDWRLGIDGLGAALARRILAEPRDVMIVAHSMGGLVSRAALLTSGMQKVRRLVLLGTPNLGSFAPLQALRGTYSVVRKIARLISSASPESLANEIFNSFPSLYHMLPSAECAGGKDLLDATEWPGSGPRPDADMLAGARDLQSKLAPADDRVTTIVGVGQETVTAAAKRQDDFVYTITRHGDGTVPAVSAALKGARCHFARVAHSELTRDPVVAAAVCDLLRTGSTKRLPTRWQTNSVAQARISDRQLRRLQTAKVDWARLEPDERRVFLENLNEPPKLRLRVPTARRQPKRRPIRKTRKN